MPSTKCGLPSRKWARLAGSIHAFIPERSGRVELDDCVGTLRHQNVAAAVLDRAGKLVGAER